MCESFIINDSRTFWPPNEEDRLSARIRTVLTGFSVIHPLVLLSVVDHAARVPLPNKKRVLGVLLGQDDGTTINVANSFAVPFEEDDKDPKTFFLDLDYVEEMWRMFRKVNGEWVWSATS